MSEDALIERFRWETRGFCLTYEWMCLVRELKARPWRWKRILQKWWVEMKREELSQKILAGLERKMLTVTGTAEFQEEGRLLKTVLVIQPHFPHEYDLLVKVAEGYTSLGGATLEKGNLVLTRTLVVNAAEFKEQLASAMGTGSESSTQSGSASDSGTVIKQPPAVLQEGKPHDGTPNEVIGGISGAAEAEPTGDEAEQEASEREPQVIN